MHENVKNFIYAGFGGMISRTATAPLERLKVLYQNKKKMLNKNSRGDNLIGETQEDRVGVIRKSNKSGSNSNKRNLNMDN